MDTRDWTPVHKGEIMNNAFLVVAVFRNNDGTLTAPEIWLGALGESPSDIYYRWQENLSNFDKGVEPIVSHVLEVQPLGVYSRIIPWTEVEKIAKDLKADASWSGPT